MAPRRQSSASHSALTSSDAAPLEVDAILAQRATYFRTHPVMINDVRIPTPPIQRTFRIMCQTVLSGLPGCAVVAFPRFGKTRAARYCCEKLMEVFPAVAAVSIHIHHNRYPPPRDFFATLLRQTGFGDTQTASTSQMRDRVVRAWQVLALTRNAPTLV